MGRAVPLKWAEQSRIEKWAETSGPRSPGPKWFWAEESRNRFHCSPNTIQSKPSILFTTQTNMSAFKFERTSSASSDPDRYCICQYLKVLIDEIETRINHLIVCVNFACDFISRTCKCNFILLVNNTCVCKNKRHACI